MTQPQLAYLKNFVMYDTNFVPFHLTKKQPSLYVMPIGMEEAPKAALDIHCLQRGGGAALTATIN